MKQIKLLVILSVLLTGCTSFEIKEIDVLKDIEQNECKEEKSKACCAIDSYICLYEVNIWGRITKKCAKQDGKCFEEIGGSNE